MQSILGHTALVICTALVIYFALEDWRCGMRTRLNMRRIFKRKNREVGQ